LGNSSTNKSHSATWQDLQNALSAKHPGISKTQLCQIVNANQLLFSVSANTVQLCQLDHDFVRKYFELAEGVEIVQHQIEGSYSSSESVFVHTGKTIMVNGLLCASCVLTTGKAVLFKFDGYTAYRMQNPLPGNKSSGHMARACLRFRKLLSKNICIRFCQGS
jgi:hypothetical protein